MKTRPVVQFLAHTAYNNLSTPAVAGHLLTPAGQGKLSAGQITLVERPLSGNNTHWRIADNTNTNPKELAFAWHDPEQGTVVGRPFSRRHIVRYAVTPYQAPVRQVIEVNPGTYISGQTHILVINPLFQQHIHVGPTEGEIVVEGLGRGPNAGAARQAFVDSLVTAINLNKRGWVTASRVGTGATSTLLLTSNDDEYKFEAALYGNDIQWPTDASVAYTGGNAVAYVPGRGTQQEAQRKARELAGYSRDPYGEMNIWKRTEQELTYDVPNGTFDVIDIELLPSEVMSVTQEPRVYDTRYQIYFLSTAPTKAAFLTLLAANLTP
jgi:hypothetical protein